MLEKVTHGRRGLGKRGLSSAGAVFALCAMAIAGPARAEFLVVSGGDSGAGVVLDPKRVVFAAHFDPKVPPVKVQGVTFQSLPLTEDRAPAEDSDNFRRVVVAQRLGGAELEVVTLGDFSLLRGGYSGTPGPFCFRRGGELSENDAGMAKVLNSMIFGLKGISVSVKGLDPKREYQVYLLMSVVGYEERSQSILVSGGRNVGTRTLKTANNGKPAGSGKFYGYAVGFSDFVDKEGAFKFDVVPSSSRPFPGRSLNDGAVLSGMVVMRTR